MVKMMITSVHTPCGDRQLPRLSGKWIRYLECIIYTKAFTILQYINQGLQIQFRAPDDERCAVRNMLSLQ